MKKIICLTLICMSLSAFGAPPPPPYPTTITPLLPTGTIYVDARSRAMNRAIGVHHLVPKRGTLYPGTTPQIYFFTNEGTFEQMKTSLISKGVSVLKNVEMAEVMKGHSAATAPKLKRFVGKSGDWMISLTSHYYDTTARQWMSKANLTFTKLVTATRRTH